MFSRPEIIEIHGYCPSIRLDEILSLNKSPTSCASNTELIFTGAPIFGGNFFKYTRLTQEDPMNRCIILSFYENPVRHFGSRNSIYTDSLSTCNNCILISDNNSREIFMDLRPKIDISKAVPAAAVLCNYD